jgi:hypothetical protein
MTVLCYAIFIIGVIIYLLSKVKERPTESNDDEYDTLPALALPAVVALMLIDLTISGLSTWSLFKIFPAPTDAPNVVTVFTGIFGVITGSIGLYKLLRGDH